MLVGLTLGSQIREDAQITGLHYRTLKRKQIGMKLLCKSCSLLGNGRMKTSLHPVHSDANKERKQGEKKAPSHLTEKTNGTLRKLTSLLVKPEFGMKESFPASMRITATTTTKTVIIKPEMIHLRQ